MKKQFIILLLALASCGGGEELNRSAANNYIRTITGLTCEKAIVTDNNFLIVGIDASESGNYDFLASQFLDEATREGVTGLRGCFIVDIKKATFQNGACVGERIGKAFK